MYPREHVNLLILLIQQILQVFDLCLQGPHSFLQRLGITTGESTAAQLITRFALETNVGALGTAWSDAIAANLFASATITGLGDPALSAGATDLDHFHGQDTGHFGKAGGHIGRRDRNFCVRSGGRVNDNGLLDIYRKAK